MQLSAILSLMVLLGCAAADPEAQYYGKPPAYKQPIPSCPAEKCFSSIRLKPAALFLASAFCNEYIGRRNVVRTTVVKTTKTVTTTSRATVVPARVTNTATVSIIPSPATTSPTCATITSAVTAAQTFTTQVFFTSRGTPAAGNIQKRAVPTIPAMLGNGCGTGKPLTSKISSACSCLLGAAKTSTSTSTSTSTVFATVISTTTNAVMTTTVSVTQLLPQVTSCQTAIVTNTLPGAPRVCGYAPPISSYTTGGQISCTAPVPAGQTNARFRIEGSTTEGNIFDGCIVTGPENITTPSGGTHLCDGTNNGANPTPGGTLTTCINNAGTQNGFDFDGTYSSSFQDFFIMRISQTAQTASQFWGVLLNRVFTPAGGCEEEIVAPQEGLWAFDAFNALAFLNLPQQYAVVQPGQEVTLVVTQSDGSGSGDVPAAGVTFGGVVSGANGNVAFTAPAQEGCYQYKAVRSGSINSQTFYLSVVSGL